MFSVYSPHRSFFLAGLIVGILSSDLTAKAYIYPSNLEYAQQADGILNLASSPVVEENFDVLHYRLDISFPLITKAFTGRVELTCRSLSAGLNQINLDMDPTMTVSKAYLGTNPIDFVADEDNWKLNLHLGQSLAVDDTITLTIEYSTADENYGFMNYEMSAYTDWAAGMFPCHDVPDDKAAYDLHLTVPIGVTVASIGLLESRTVSDDGEWETFNWATELPVSTHLLGIMMSSYYTSWSDWYITSANDSIEVAYYIFERDSAAAKLDFINVLDALKYYSSVFGPYPFEKYGMAEVEPLAYGAMEYQTMSMISSNWIQGTGAAEDGFVHELAHSWWGNSVGVVDWHDMWLSEGFAEYMAALYREHKYGTEAYKSLMADKKARYLIQAEIKDYPITEPIFNSSVIGIIYKKGAWVLHMLRHVVGTENMWSVLQNFYAANEYSSVTLADFQSAAEEIYGSSLAWFFDEWLYDKGYPRIAATHETTRITDNHYECQITLEQVQSDTQAPIFTMPIDIRLSGTTGTIDTTVWMNAASNSYKIVTSFEPLKLDLDPEQWLLMKIQSNTLEIQQNARQFNLFSNYPNPFNSGTTIHYELSEASNVKISIYNILGQEVATLINEHQEAGYRSIRWNGTDNSGSKVSGGMYLYRIQARSFSKTMKMVLLK